MTDRVLVVIPARYGSTRFEGKALADLAGRPLVVRTLERALGMREAHEVLVATDDERIADACRAFGAEVAMTAATHPTGTDRIAEAAAGLDADLVVNVQGDEPLIEGFVIDAAVAALEEDPEAAMATIAHAAEPAGLDDPNRVKLVLDHRGRALYFSRSRIPYPRQPGARTLQHVGIYAYRRAFLLEFVRLPQTELECSEQLEQLRALEHGHAIRVAVIDGWRSVPVDVPEDVALVEAALREAGRC